jgi:hypothetical protein
MAVAKSAANIGLLARGSAATFLFCEDLLGSANRMNGQLSAEEAAFQS